MVSPRFEVHMPDMGIGRGTCRFIAKKKDEVGAPPSLCSLSVKLCQYRTLG